MPDLTTALNELNGRATSLRQALQDPNLTPVNAGSVKQAVNQLEEVEDTLDDVTDFVEAVEAFAELVEMLEEKRIRLEWRPEVKDWPADKPIFLAKNGTKNDTPASLVLGAEVQIQDSGSGKPGVEVYCYLDNFGIDLIGPATSFLRIFMDRIGFFAGTSKKAGVDVVFGGMVFAGPLAFVETLRKIIPMDGFSDPPYVEIDESGLTAGFTVDIPSLSVGVFAIQNISLGAEANLPFIGDPLSIKFLFNTRENSCRVTVMCIGGGFYLGLIVDTQGFVGVEAGIEVAASLSLDFGVASGEVHVAVGFYFSLKLEESTALGKDVAVITLAATFRVGGHVQVMGMVSITIELRLELTYIVDPNAAALAKTENPAPGKLYGKATFILEVEVFGLGPSVELTVEKQFAGSDSDPTFEEQMSDPYLEPVQNISVFPWPQYCSSFAAV